MYNETAKKENFDHCKSIAAMLKKYCNGLVFENVSTGEVVELDDSSLLGQYENNEEYQQLSMMDFFNNCLDIEYRIGPDKEYRSACIMIAAGGPNIFIDTAKSLVMLYWWNEYAEAFIDTDVIKEVDAVFEELYNC